MKCSKGIAEQVGSLSEKRGDFVRFFSPSQASDRDRIGEPHTLPFRPSRFRDAISAKAKWKAHSSILEAHGLLLAVKWLLRTPVNFNRRLVVLVDAKAVLGSASKGRTSAPSLRGILRHVAGLLLATNSLLRLVYVPSEHNPADAPSRGVRRRPTCRVKRRTKKSRLRTFQPVFGAVGALCKVWGTSF